MQKKTETVDIAILLLPRFSNLCLSNAVEPLRAANGFAPAPRYRWRFLGLDSSPVRSSSGMQVMPDARLDTLGRVDRLYIVSSYDHLAHDTAPLRRALRAAAGRTRLMLGLDTGAWLMAAAGLLDGKRATVHWDLLEPFAERFHRVEVERVPYRADGDRITCAGALATFEMTRDMIRADLGAAVAWDVEGLFLSDGAARAAAPQGDPLVARMVARMRLRLEVPQALPQLARDLGVTPRTLTRRVRAATGLGPGALYRHLRLSAARQMVEAGTLSVTEIALRSGYEDPTAFTRAFRARFGASPQAMRRSPVAASTPSRAKNAAFTQ